MGQYQQWLFAQEIDRRLKAEIETLETEYYYLQDRITILEQVVPATENVILQALATHLENHLVSEQQPEQAPPNQVAAIPEAQPAETQRVSQTTPQTPATPGAESMSYLPRIYTQREMSEDMLAFFDRRSQTDPRLSALLQRERQRASSTSTDDFLVDDETRRLNENIQRWFVRWHREVASEAEEVENEQ